MAITSSTSAPSTKVVESEKRKWDATKPLPASLVSGDKVKKEVGALSGVSEEQVRYFRKPMPLEIMLSNAVSKGTQAFLGDAALAKIHKGKNPSLDQLLTAEGLAIVVRRYVKGEHRAIPAIASVEIKRCMRDLYLDYTSNAQGTDVKHQAFLPLLNGKDNPAASALVEAVKNLHKAFEPAAKPIVVQERLVGEDESRLSLEPPAPAPKKS